MTKVNPKCGACGETKDPSEFYPDRRRPQGFHTYCKDCCKKRAKARYAQDPEGHKRRNREWVANNRDRARLRKLASKYGISIEELEALPKVCVICGSTEDLCVDHSHQTGRVRGLLCRTCNAGLGYFKDNPILIGRAADYLFGVATADIFTEGGTR